jgi:hypothetical protein
VLLSALAGCTQAPRYCVPASYCSNNPAVELQTIRYQTDGGEPMVVAAQFQRFRYDAAEVPDPAPGQPHRILALSGGGAYGAYTVGVLNGWTRSGDRPEFDIVTGISTGSLIATYAFLGPRYDLALYQVYTGVTDHDIYRKRPKLALLFSESTASSEPMKRLIESRIDDRLLHEVAQAHARGRRLYVGTTDLDRRRFVVWDMGQIASSGRPDALELYQKILLASASVPGFFPPVQIERCGNQQRCTELHADGGASCQVYVPGSILKAKQQASEAGPRSLAGSQVFIIMAGKLYADPECVNPRLTDIAGAAVKSLVHSEARNELIKIWTQCQLSGMDYQLSAIPQSARIPADGLSFDPAGMRMLYNLGYCNGLRHIWTTSPPE